MDRGRLAAFAALQGLEHGASWAQAWERAAERAAPGALDRRFAHELVSGSLRWRGRLDWILGLHLDRSLSRLEPDVRVVLRLGLYQLLEVVRVADHAAVHETVELAKLACPRAAGYVNAVLRAALRGRDAVSFPDRERDPVGYLVAALSHPEWLVRRWLGRFGLAAAEALCAYDNRRPDLCLRPNRRRTTGAELLLRLPGSEPGRWAPEAVRCPGPAYGGARQLVGAGLASVQDESGMLVAPLLEPRPGERCLDLAAAPGGKACHIAELLDGTGSVVALDRSPARLERVRDNVRRLGLDNVLVAEADSRTLAARPADAVLVDAPCTGLGVLARRPDLRWRKHSGDLARSQKLQLELLEAAARHVRAGGRLVYSVCSFEPEETLEVVRRFAASHPEMRLEDGPGPQALRAAPGILYSLPQSHGIDGGFAARWRRHG